MEQKIIDEKESGFLKNKVRGILLVLVPPLPYLMVFACGTLRRSNIFFRTYSLACGTLPQAVKGRIRDRSVCTFMP
ncbi:hypothetical protein SAMN05421736_101268 [Evansella caseinilytica]|uniref:Uncharacterized protein n=1 Tax=Evansella caseinilytica TaxID=1503961 RepID=A0A1H3GV29_9BACI|nr:hypothetical protein SAMN05421736_101268 [Evansella caseinilytica]